MSDCFRLTDWHVAHETLLESWDEHSEDGANLSPPNTASEYWIGFLEDGKYAGAVRVCQVTSVLFEAHICILKEYRRKAKDYVILAYEWVIKNLPIEKLYVNIPEVNKRVIFFALSIGMKKQGYNSNCWLKNGKLGGMVQMGITKQEMQSCLQR